MHGFAISKGDRFAVFQDGDFGEIGFGHSVVIIFNGEIIAAYREAEVDYFTGLEGMNKVFFVGLRNGYTSFKGIVRFVQDLGGNC